MGRNEEMDEVSNRDWLTKEEAEAFLGKNSSFYLNNWKSYSDSRLKGWNWAAMLVSLEWMAYRRMYLEAFLYFVITGFVSICVSLLLAGLGIRFEGRLLGDAFRLLIGALGNAIYRKKALRMLHKTGGMNDTQRIEFLRSKGGVSIVGVIGCIVIEIVYFLLLMI